MDLGIVREKIAGFLRKYGYVVLILAAGIFLMCMPDGTRTQSPVSETVESSLTVPDTQAALEEILSQIDGAGKVKVLLTVGEGERILYQMDENSATGPDTRSVKVETVIITDQNRAQAGLIQQINPPIYLGAVVVCQGGDRASVRLAITEAIRAATGLTADKITVLKMK